MEESIIISIKVIPKASRNEIVGWHGEELKVKVTSAPEKGLANKALTAFIAKALKVAKSRVSVVGGETSRHKRLCLEGVTVDYIENILGSPNKNLQKNAGRV
ncbi:MAG: YggU family protein [Waddliaceae bacterium]|nr:YggU family protein [Waddliaceae bacterium]